MSFLLSRLKAPEPAGGRVKRDHALEGLRGLCAFLVFLGHVIIGRGNFNVGFVAPDFMLSFQFASAAVLMFFVISGYVIGLTTTQAASTPATKVYLKKRFWRIYPIMTLVILVLWLFYPATPGLTILGNILGLQNEGFPNSQLTTVLVADPVLWSLHYELVFYLFFIAVWFMRPRLLWLVAFCLACALSGWAFQTCPIWIPRYGCGLLYWICGLAIAWLVPSSQKQSSGNWLCAFFVAYATWIIAPTKTVGILHSLKFVTLVPTSIHRLDFLPAAAWLVMALTGRSFKHQRAFEWVCWSFPAISLVVELATKTLCSPLDLWMSTLSLAAACTLLITKWLPEPRPFQLLAPFGEISFAFYLVAWPSQFLLVTYLPLPQFGLSSLIWRSVVSFAIAVILAWLLEKKFQSWLRSILRRSTPRPSD